jgi:polysaccharide export outer membrane protein
MKKTLLVGCYGLLVLLISVSIVSPQTDKESISKKQDQGEVVSHSNQYIIGPEDVLNIHVWREETLSRTVPVRMDGKISLPLIDEITAAGLTPLQLKEVLVKKFKEFLDNPIVSVLVTEANSAKIFISGQVRNQGVFLLRSETTLAQVIAWAGGFTSWANQKKILIIRRIDGKENRITVNYKKIMSGDSNIIIMPGDTIIVP